MKGVGVYGAEIRVGGFSGYLCELLTLSFGSFTDILKAVSDWKEKRSYKALETGKDTFKWFFMLMNEYLDVERGSDLDLRNYVKRQERYNEY